MASNDDRNSQLENDIDKYQSHSKIDLSFRQLTDRDLDIVVKQAIVQKQCTALLLNDNRITVEGVTIIANALRNNTTLLELNLWNNQVSDLGVFALTQVLSADNSTLQSIGLGQNRITDAGAEHIAHMLKINTTITRLWLFYNDIGDRGVKFLSDALAYDNKQLQWLDLRLNKSVTDASVDSVCNMLNCNRSLKKFWMEYCNLSRMMKAKVREIGQAKADFDIGA